MSDKAYPLSAEEIESWFRSKETTVISRGVALVEIRTSRRTNKPGVVADFDSAQGIGRVSMWVSGETDFEVAQRSDGKNVFVRPEVFFSLDSPALTSAFDDFLDCILHPEAAISRVA